MGVYRGHREKLGGMYLRRYSVRIQETVPLEAWKPQQPRGKSPLENYVEQNLENGNSEASLIAHSQEIGE